MGANHKDLTQCYHKNLESFQMSKMLSWRRVSWAEILSSYDLIIQYLDGKMNHADRPSRRPDYKEGYERPTARLLATLAATTTEPFNDLLPAIEPAQDTNVHTTDIRDNIGLLGPSKAGGQDRSKNKNLEMQLKVMVGALTYEGRICVGEALHNHMISLFHNNPLPNHFGALSTAKLISRD